MVYKLLGYNITNFIYKIFILQSVSKPGNTRLTESDGIIKNVFYKTKKNDIVMFNILFIFYKKFCSGQILQNDVKCIYKSLN